MNKFQKKEENFTCDNCGTINHGDGWTDHCRNCLYSKHVDNHPGDRGNKCHGLMEPIGIITKKEEKIVYECMKCKTRKICRSSKNDNRQEILKLLSQPVDLSR